MFCTPRDGPCALLPYFLLDRVVRRSGVYILRLGRLRNGLVVVFVRGDEVGLARIPGL